MLGPRTKFPTNLLPEAATIDGAHLLAAANDGDLAEVKRLVAVGADVETTCEDGRNALMVAICNSLHESKKCDNGDGSGFSDAFRQIAEALSAAGCTDQGMHYSTEPSIEKGEYEWYHNCDSSEYTRQIRMPICGTRYTKGEFDLSAVEHARLPSAEERASWEEIPPSISGMAVLRNWLPPICHPSWAWRKKPVPFNVWTKTAQAFEAARLDNQALLETMLHRHANINAISASDGSTMLHEAARFNSLGCVQLLLSYDNRADHFTYLLKDFAGQTTMDVARGLGHKACLKLLEKYALKWATYGCANPALCRNPNCWNVNLPDPNGPSTTDWDANDPRWEAWVQKHAMFCEDCIGASEAVGGASEEAAAGASEEAAAGASEEATAGASEEAAAGASEEAAAGASEEAAAGATHTGAEAHARAHAEAHAEANAEDARMAQERQRKRREKKQRAKRAKKAAAAEVTLAEAAATEAMMAEAAVAEVVVAEATALPTTNSEHGYAADDVSSSDSTDAKAHALSDVTLTAAPLTAPSTITATAVSSALGQSTRQGGRGGRGLGGRTGRGRMQRDTNGRGDGGGAAAVGLTKPLIMPLSLLISPPAPRATSPTPTESTLAGEGCKICMEALATHLSTACGHKCVCMSCADKLNECPICRVSVPNWLKVINC